MLVEFDIEEAAVILDDENAFYRAASHRVYNNKIEYCNFQNSIVLISIKC